MKLSERNLAAVKLLLQWELFALNYGADYLRQPIGAYLHAIDQHDQELQRQATERLTEHIEAALLQGPQKAVQMMRSIAKAIDDSKPMDGRRPSGRIRTYRHLLSYVNEHSAPSHTAPSR